MTIDLLLEVGHATVADLDCVTVEDFVEHMIFRELFVEDFKERSSNVGSHVLAKRWVIPNDVSVYIFIYSLRHRKCGVRGYIHKLFVSKPERARYERVRAFDTNNE